MCLRTLWATCVLAGALTLPGATPALAVIIDTLTGTGNTSAPADDPGWANVGIVGNGSAVYLGNRWAITASHVWSGVTTFSGTAYPVVPGSEITLTNNGVVGKTALTDLVLYQLASDPGLPTLSIASSTPTNGSAVTMVGAGRNRGNFRTWHVNTGTTPWVWTVDNVNPNAAGYLWDASRTLRWGTNSVDAAGWITYTIDTPKSVYALQSQFTYSGTASPEAVAAAGDSGGGLFRKNGSSWELAGIMLVVDAYSGQPGNTAVYGNATYSADLSFYRSQIVAVVVPEPSAVALAVLGGLAVSARAVRRRLTPSAGSGRRVRAAGR